MDISAVINTYNDGAKLEGCLESVIWWVNEIVVVDQGSVDKTLEIAKKFKAKVFYHKHVPYVEIVRNFSLQQAGGDWLMVLDPDEVIPRPLAKKLQGIAEQGEYDSVNIPRKNIIFGKWLRHTNCWPDRHVRFFKKGQVSWGERIHQYPEVRGKILELPAVEELAIEHHNYASIDEFFQRQNRYSEIAAQNRFDTGERFTWKNFFWKPKRLFLQRYVRHLGFLDGFQGLAFSYSAAVSQIAEEVKLWEKQNSKQ